LTSFPASFLSFSLMPKLRYSDRKRMAEQGSLGPLEYDDVPEDLRRAIVSIYQNAARSNLAGGAFDKEVVATCSQHFGQRFWGVNSSAFGVEQFVAVKPGFNSPYRSTTDDVLDVVEILVEEGPKRWTFKEHGTYSADQTVEARINAAFVRHRFGYRVEGGEVHRIGSPALDEEVVGPALFVAPDGRPQTRVTEMRCITGAAGPMSATPLSRTRMPPWRRQ
jgi:hypothetical protein